MIVDGKERRGWYPVASISNYRNRTEGMAWREEGTEVDLGENKATASSRQGASLLAELGGQRRKWCSNSQEDKQWLSQKLRSGLRVGAPF